MECLYLYHILRYHWANWENIGHLNRLQWVCRPPMAYPLATNLSVLHSTWDRLKIKHIDVHLYIHIPWLIIVAHISNIPFRFEHKKWCEAFEMFTALFYGVRSRACFLFSRGLDLSDKVAQQQICNVRRYIHKHFMSSHKKQREKKKWARKI